MAMNVAEVLDHAAGSIKCVVWDLDDTLWLGTLLEDGEVSTRDETLEVLRELDRRGILLSIASRNEPSMALEKLHALGIADLFLHPQIGWGSKSESIRAIASALNIGLDSIAFVDDQPFERAEVATALPSVLCLGPDDIPRMPVLPALTPLVVTEDARNRRHLYAVAARREQAEREFVGPSDEFLRSLDIECRIRAARDGDIDRMQELTLRTHQLNSTGYTYSREELVELTKSPNHRVLVATLSDRFGSYGSVGVALLERTPAAWVIKLILVSCRVISRGVGSVLLSHIAALARHDGLRLRAEFAPTGRNRIMEVTYRLAGFRTFEGTGDRQLLQYEEATPIVAPAGVRVVLEV